jgi:hypothetical protein
MGSPAGSKSPRTKENMRYLAVTLIAKSPTLTQEHHALLPSGEYPSEFILDPEHSIKLKKEEQSDPVFDVTIFDARTHRPFSPQIQCPFLPHSETVASFSRGGIEYTASITPQIIEQDMPTIQHKK